MTDEPSAGARKHPDTFVLGQLPAPASNLWKTHRRALLPLLFARDYSCRGTKCSRINKSSVSAGIKQSPSAEKINSQSSNSWSLSGSEGPNRPLSLSASGFLALQRLKESVKFALTPFTGS